MSYNENDDLYWILTVMDWYYLILIPFYYYSNFPSLLDFGEVIEYYWLDFEEKIRCINSIDLSFSRVANSISIQLLTFSLSGAFTAVFLKVFWYLLSMIAHWFDIFRAAI